MKKALIYLFSLFISFSTFSANAQNVASGLDSLQRKLSENVTNYYRRYPQEKVFLHIDRNFYITGETIWYKVYSLAYGRPSNLSRIVYVRLSDAKGSIIKQDMLPVKNGAAFGDIDLPDTLATGNYQIMAFTSWMLNFDKGSIYRQGLYVQKLNDSVRSAPTKQKRVRYNVRFFPEGGDLVYGAVCNVAFKATDEYGNPITIDGNIFSGTKQITKITTVHDGMGSFEMEFLPGTKYVAHIHFPDNTTQVIPLPDAKETGLSFRVNSMPQNEIELKIIYSGQSTGRRNIVITALQNNGTNATYPMQLDQGINIIYLKKNSFSTGILRLTVFEERKIPLAERLIFIDNHDQLKLTLVKDTLSFLPKGKNVWTLHSANGTDQPAKVNLSVSVTDAGIGSESEESISSYFLMSSELRDHIYNPSYYFKNNDDSLKKQLDLVMLTNGWRHFIWDTIFKNKPVQLKFGMEKTLVFGGKIENYHDRDNLKVKILLTSRDSSKNIIEVEPDSTGVFWLKDYARSGTTIINYQVVNRNDKKQNVKVLFFKKDADTVYLMPDSSNKYVSTSNVSRYFLDSVRSNRFTTKGYLLKGVEIKGQKLDKTAALIEKHVKHLEPDKAYTFDLINSSPPPVSIMDYIRGKIPGLQINISPNGYITFTYHGSGSLIKDNPSKQPKLQDQREPDEPFFYVDEASATLEEVKSIPIQDVALIRFAPPPVWFAPMGGGSSGAILIYTKQFGDEQSKRKISFDQYAFDSYSVVREFASPNYSFTYSDKADLRSTLYWNHDLNVDYKGTVKVSFFNSDKAKKFRITVQAMDSEGKVGFLNATF